MIRSGRPMRTITIRGARANNLKGFDLSLPKHQLIVATGVSGSGKSSLVFDILFEEGRRQYLRSIGVLTGLGDEQDFDAITGLAPTIAVQQSIIRQSNPRSTVGSRTQILGMLAVLYAAEGRITCSSCGTPVGDLAMGEGRGADLRRLREHGRTPEHALLLAQRARRHVHQVRRSGGLPRDRPRPADSGRPHDAGRGLRVRRDDGRLRETPPQTLRRPPGHAVLDGSPTRSRRRPSMGTTRTATP